MAKISVIVPVYNTERYLRKCVESILSQSFEDFELLLIDDGSRDSSGEICDDYMAKDHRVKSYHKPNGGVSSARNLGLELSEGEWVAFVDSDDWVHNEYLEILYKAAISSQSDIVFCNIMIEQGEKYWEIDTYDWHNVGLQGLSDYIIHTWTTTSAGIHKKELYDNLRAPKGVTFCEDFVQMVQLCYNAKKITHIDDYLYNYYQREDSLVHNLNDKTIEDEQYAYEFIINFFKGQNVWSQMKKAMCFRALKASQESLLSPKRLKNFQTYVPEKKDYIFSCPYLNKKQKIMAWSTTHKLYPVTLVILFLRSLLRR